uniref:Uncharacterized protein n=1 Tax=Setaria viridis TaxID=4556 RepID=A0A4U6THW9_SETVI|nr:hypothetical protein SEVIR_8G213000v2 [Setaria viridis]
MSEDSSAFVSRGVRQCCFGFWARGCQYYQWEDEIWARVLPAAIPTPTPMSPIQEGGQAGGGVVQDRVMQRLRLIEKLVFVAIFLALYAIIKK